MKKAYLSGIFLTLIALSSFITDGDWLTGILSRLNSRREQYPQEKVYMHFDKPYYIIGEDIWFKAYIVNAERNELSALSKILYVDLIDDQDSIKKTVVLPIVNGLTNGDIKLTDSLVHPGNYHIKAYTRWMQNFSSDFIFDKKIFIGDARTETSVLADAKFTFDDKHHLQAVVAYKKLEDKTPVTNKQVTYTLNYKGQPIANGKTVTNNRGLIDISIRLRQDYRVEDLYLKTAIPSNTGIEIDRDFAVYDLDKAVDVQFFPEGGDLVAGLRSKVGFKATIPGGRSANITGYIVDQNINKKVAVFTTVHAGMGVFALQPLAGHTYVAVVENKSGKSTNYQLPAVKNSGYVFSVNHTSDDSVTVRVETTEDFITGQKIALIVQQNDVVKYAAKIKIDQPSVGSRLANINFSTGITQFTLLSPDGSPIAERLIFIDRHDQLNLKITSDKKVYNKHEKVDISLSVKNNNMAAAGNFSVAVVDAGKIDMDEDKVTSIYSDLLLTSDLRGYIEDPNYYFTNITQDKASQLDNLLLTQGWRRFKWTDINNATVPAIIKYQPSKSFQVSGKITSLNDKPIPYGKITLFANTVAGPITLDTIANEDGKFLIDGLEFMGIIKFVVKATNAKDRKNVKILLNNRPLPAYLPEIFKSDEVFTISAINYLRSTQKDLDENNIVLPAKTRMLKEVKIKGKLFPDPDAIANSSKLGSGTADIVIKKEKIAQYPSLIYSFYGLAGLEVDPKTQTVYRIGRVVSLTKPGGEPMAIFLDGVKIGSDMLKEIQPESVEGIEIFKSLASTAIYGSDGYWGVIQITTKVGNSASYFPPITNVSHIKVQGYSIQREFYSPVFKTQEDNKRDDVRSTIYWNPNINTDKDGKADFSFYTANAPATYKVIIEGLDYEGHLAHQTYSFEVK
ncbi:SusC/RagA family TonB-linked outer membrane protein [Mucilaginibacter segetis]|uniref:TonB-dependent receptor plug domain-containing protein n=1 Tax=Mucilaginibacter segetis TaxID=2793071 RepID=A0A934PSQ8_9SPHI|nr:hypothetical protein [Mucilaginibacter segetis]MBK0379379.1 hypothetical protein [Mucilaginibacter segetis]